MRYKYCTLEYKNELKSFSLGLRNNDITIGSGSSDYIEVTGEGIVPMHARLVYTYSGVYLIVLGNTGCTLENHRFLGPGSATMLTNPTNFSLGDVLFTYHEEKASSHNSAHGPAGAIRIVGENPSLPPVVLGTQDNPITLGIDLPNQALRNASIFSTGDAPSQPAASTSMPDPALALAVPAVAQSDAWFNKELISCSICLDVMQNATSCVPCMHKFCNFCIIRWIDTNSSCPRCRQIMTKVTVDPDFSAICSDYVTAKGIVFVPHESPVVGNSDLVHVRRPNRTMQTATRSRPRARRRLGFQ